MTNLYDAREAALNAGDATAYNMLDAMLPCAAELERSGYRAVNKDGRTWANGPKLARIQYYPEDSAAAIIYWGR